MSSEVTRIMLGVSQSSIKGYPHASISSRSAFEWTLNKIIRSNTSGFMLLFVHVQAPDEDGIDMNSIYTSPQDFKDANRRDKINLLEFFVSKCHQIGVACEAWIRKGDPQETICHEVGSSGGFDWLPVVATATK